MVKVSASQLVNLGSIFLIKKTSKMAITDLLIIPLTRDKVGDKWTYCGRNGNRLCTINQMAPEKLYITGAIRGLADALVAFLDISLLLSRVCCGIDGVINNCVRILLSHDFHAFLLVSF